jgi:Asp-tRNA(Asn)/Glu-tRNA(Gln) amidotransferase A subunit family amidase
VRNIAAAGVASAASSSLAGATQPATTQPSLTPADVTATNRALGHDYTDAETRMMTEGVQGKRDVITRIRSQPVPYTTPPAVSFDARLPGQTFPSGPSSFTLSDQPLPDYNGDPATLAFANAADLSRLIHAKKVTSLDLTKMYLARLKEIGPRLNCVITLTEELALSQAKRADEELAAGKSRGPLHGLPWGAKDLLATKDYPTTWGVKLYESRVFDHDATVVSRLDAAGAVLCAKLSLGELCMGDVWYNGLTRCPWNPKEGSSGSSAGPCAAVAAGLVSFAIGSETLGSIISPCMVNGTVGLRPTYGRVSRHGAMPLSDTMDKLGPIARSVEDCAMILSAIHGPDAHDPTCPDIPFRWNAKDENRDGRYFPSPSVTRLRVGIDPAAFDFSAGAFAKSPDLKSLYQSALDHLRSLVGRDLTPITLPSTKPYTGLASLVIAAESAANFSDLLTTGDIRTLRQQGPGSWPNTFRVGSTLPAADYLRAMQVRTQLMHAMRDALKDVDCYLTIPYAGATIAFTNLTGHPSLVFRAGTFNGRPKLLELVGQPFREDAILSLAHAFERTTNHHTTWPDTSKIPPNG